MKLKRPIKSISGIKVRINALQIHYYLCPLILIFASFPVTIISGNSIKESSDLGIIWQEGTNYERLNAYGNLLKNYADGSGAIYYKIRELEGKGAAVKNMERVYENGGELKKTLNVIERTEDSGSVIRWLEDGTSTWGWTHIKRPERLDQITSKFGPKTEQEVQEMIFETLKSGEIIKSKSLIGDKYQYAKKFLAKDGSLFEFSVVVSDRPIGIGRGNVITAFPGV
ncbi:MAG: hypothetical protein FIB08_00775 [Candidatus Methanoperedens sp.]|nr:hypothetical protein [Candidatus Methanoperedens sp.]